MPFNSVYFFSLPFLQNALKVSFRFLKDRICGHNDGCFSIEIFSHAISEYFTLCIYVFLFLRENVL